MGQGRFPGLRFHHRHVMGLGKPRQRIASSRIEHPAAGNQHRLFSAPDCRYGPIQLVGIGPHPALRVHGLRKKRDRIIIGLGLGVLTQRQRHRPAIGRIGQNLHGPPQRRHDLLGPGDPVEIARYGLETIIGRHRPVGKILDLLQHRVGPPVGKHIAG